MPKEVPDLRANHLPCLLRSCVWNRWTNLHKLLSFAQIKLQVCCFFPVFSMLQYYVAVCVFCMFLMLPFSAGLYFCILVFFLMHKLSFAQISFQVCVFLCVFNAFNVDIYLCFCMFLMLPYSVGVYLCISVCFRRYHTLLLYTCCFT